MLALPIVTSLTLIFNPNPPQLSAISELDGDGGSTTLGGHNGLKVPKLIFIPGNQKSLKK